MNPNFGGGAGGFDFELVQRKEEHPKVLRKKVKTEDELQQEALMREVCLCERIDDDADDDDDDDDDDDIFQLVTPPRVCSNTCCAYIWTHFVHPSTS